jgi:hypothetical protein
MPKTSDSFAKMGVAMKLTQKANRKKMANLSILNLDDAPSVSYFHIFSDIFRVHDQG